ncbi:hypothetical protein WJX72_006747 [[Myrmecia] bisecta]|uniref:Translocator protein n=1 Tax=[Myrmecia] bisecta TaxID=41462 RepID=A0AAW1PEM3_9CHLO
MMSWPLAVALAVPIAAGTAIGVSTRDEIDWSSKLRRPSWDPPTWLFGPAWTFLYTLMGYASFRVWSLGGWAAQSQPLTLYLVQLGLNLAWPLIFFRFHRIGLAMLDNLALLAAAAATAASFHTVDQTAAYLLAPYLAWLVFANTLNFTIWRMNPKGGFTGDGPSSGSSGTVPATASLYGEASSSSAKRGRFSGGRSRHALSVTAAAQVGVWHMPVPSSSARGFHSMAKGGLKTAARSTAGAHAQPSLTCAVHKREALWAV